MSHGVSIIHNYVLIVEDGDGDISIGVSSFNSQRRCLETNKAHHMGSH